MRARLWKSTSTLELGTAITATTQYKYIERIKKSRELHHIFSSTEVMMIDAICNCQHFLQFLIYNGILYCHCNASNPIFTKHFIAQIPAENDFSPSLF